MPTPAPRTVRFGALNAAAIAVCFGGMALAVLGWLAVLLWAVLRPIARMRAREREGVVATLGLVALGLLFAAFAAMKLSHGPGQTHGPVALARDLLRVISFSYVFLRGVDMVRSVAWGRERLLDPLSLAGFLGPFHMLLAGPITPYSDWVLSDDDDPPTPTFRRLIGAANIVVLGLFFKAVLAQSMRLFLVGMHATLSANSWIDTGYLIVYLYFDFAGYSLVALGIGRLLAVPTPDNFDRPFLAPTVTEFWSRWHRSLSTFLRNNVFLPLQLILARRLRRRKHVLTAMQVLPLAAAFCAAGLWHRFSVRFVLWGCAMGLIMGIEKLVHDHLVTREWCHTGVGGAVLRALGPVYSLSVVTTGIVLVAEEMFG